MVPTTGLPLHVQINNGLCEWCAFGHMTGARNKKPRSWAEFQIMQIGSANYTSGC